MFAAYVSARGHAIIDRALYLPKSWTGDPARLAATHVPEAIAFVTTPGLAVDMIRRALAADVPFSWVAADAVYAPGTSKEACAEPAKTTFLRLSRTTISASGRVILWAQTKPRNAL